MDTIKMTKITLHIKNNKGFVLLFAVTISAILLAIALGVSDIALKEIKFSTSARDTNEAFFAADTGIECALFNDKSTSNSFKASGGSGVVQCTDLSISINQSSPLFWDFVLVNLGNTGQSCAKVTVDKTVPGETVIISKGYNMGNTECMSANPDRIERELRITY